MAIRSLLLLPSGLCQESKKERSSINNKDDLPQRLDSSFIFWLKNGIWLKKKLLRKKIDFLCCRCRCCRSCCCCWSCCCCRCWCCCCCCCATSFSFSSSFCERRPTLKLLDCHDFRKRGRSHEVIRLWITSAVVVVESNPRRCGKSSENAAEPTFGLELFRWQQFSRFFISFLKMSPFIFLVALLSYLFVVHPDGLWPSSEMSATLWNNNKILLWAKKRFCLWSSSAASSSSTSLSSSRSSASGKLPLLLLLSLKAKKWKTLLSSFLQKKAKRN